MRGEELIQVSVSGAQLHTPEALPLPEAARVLTAVSELLDALADEEGVSPVRLGLGEVRESSAGFVFAIAPRQPRAKVLHITKAFYDAVTKRGAGYGQRVQAALNDLESVSKDRTVRVKGLGALKDQMPEARVVRCAPSTGSIKATSLDYGIVAGLRDSHKGTIAISLRPAFGGERIEVFAAEKWAPQVKFRQGLWCRVEFTRGPDGRRRDLWARAVGPWNPTGLAEAIGAAVAAHPGAHFDRGALRSVDEKEDQLRAQEKQAAKARSAKKPDA